MERQTKHRILAIFVVIGLVIILLPLFQSDKDISAETTTVEAPPFPDQAEQIDSGSGSDQSAIDNIEDFKNPPKAQYQHEDKKAHEVPVKGGVVTIHTDDYRPPGGAASQQEVNEEAVESAKPDVADKVMMLDEPEHEKIQRNKQIFRNGSRKATEHGQAKVKLSDNKHSIKNAVYRYETKKKKGKNTKDSNDLFKLQKPVWVIQVGSFKYQSNAQQLVNKLRAKGYPAFMQQAAKQTRVYVGPKDAQKLARDLAVQIHSELKIKGIVVSYKPLKI